MEWTSIVNAAYDCTIGVQASITNTADISVQLKDFDGKSITEIGVVDMYLTDDIAGLTSTDVTSASADTGIVHPIVATYAYKLITNASGLSVVELDGNTASTVFMHVVLPNGRVKHSAAIVFTG